MKYLGVPEKIKNKSLGKVAEITKKIILKYCDLLY